LVAGARRLPEKRRENAVLGARGSEVVCG
jgi:hypothetical protein